MDSVYAWPGSCGPSLGRNSFAARYLTDGRPSRIACDTQSVKTTEMGGESGYDGNKKIDGRKRHIVVDTLGLLIVVTVTAANLDDGTHAPRVLGKLKPES